MTNLKTTNSLSGFAKVRQLLTKYHTLDFFNLECLHALDASRYAST